MNVRAWTLAATALLTAACADNRFREVGTGSGNLTIDARAEVDNDIANATRSDQFHATLVVHLSKDGQPVVGATVEIGSSIGAVPLPPVGDPGRYAGTQAGYARDYTLSARLGDDYVEGVALSGPDAHSFSAPMLGAQVPWGQPLAVTWSPGESTQAAISARELDRIEIADTGSYSLPGTELRRPDTGSTEDERVRIVRTETITPAGADSGSQFRVSIRNEVTIVVVP